MARFRDQFAQIDPSLIVVESNFNPRNFESAEAKEYYQGLKASILSRGVERPLVVRENPKDETRPILLGGETRLRIVRELLAEGTPIKSVPIQYKEAHDPAERVMHVLLDNSGRPFTQLESGNLYKKLVKFGWTKEQIANQANVTLNYVTRALDLENLPADVKALVVSGEVTPVAAIQETKSDPDNAAKTLASKVVTVTMEDGSKKTVPVKNVRKSKASKLEEAVTALYEDANGRDFDMEYTRALAALPEDGKLTATFPVSIALLMKVFGQLPIYSEAV